MRPCDDDERGVNRDKNDRSCGHTRGKKKKAAKCKMERFVSIRREMTEAGLKEDKTTIRVAWDWEE